MFIIAVSSYCFFWQTYYCHIFVNEILYLFGIPPDIQDPTINFLEKKHEIFTLLFGSIFTFATSLFASLLTIIIAYFIFRSINQRQTEITRLSFLRQHEEDIMRIMSEKTCLHPDVFFSESKWGSIQDYTKKEYFNYRWALNEEPWLVYDGPLDQFFKYAHLEIDGTNTIQFRFNGDRLSSKAIHEILAWFRSVNRARELKFVEDDDLELLWRPILAHSFNNRYKFLKLYFQDDIRVFERLILDVIKIIRDRQPNTWSHYKYQIDGDFREFLKNNDISI